MQEQTSSNSLGERVPKLRFPEFEGGWDFELFSDLFTFLSNNTLSRAELSETGNIRNIHYGDILVRYTDVINIDDDIFKAKYLSDITFSSNDYALNTLLTLLPKKIHVHLIDNCVDEFIHTLGLIFEDKVEVCTDCNICKIYKNSKNNKSLLISR